MAKGDRCCLARGETFFLRLGKGESVLLLISVNVDVHVSVDKLDSESLIVMGNGFKGIKALHRSSEVLAVGRRVSRFGLANVRMDSGVSRASLESWRSGADGFATASSFDNPGA